MSKTIEITGSIVVYKENFEELNKTIQSFIDSNFTSKLFLIENFQNPFSEKLIKSPKVQIIKSERNLGFGAGHNRVLDFIKYNSDYHLVLNPDVSFDSGLLEKLVSKLEKEPEVSLIAPKVLFPNGKLQNSCRRYPSLFELLIRRLPLIRPLFISTYKKGIYSDKDLEKPFYAEYLTGCFHLYRTKDLIQLGGFDERYFLYMEDVDICRKIDQSGKKKLYYPEVSINHVLKQESSKKLSLFIRHTISMMKYYKKWGF